MTPFGPTVATFRRLALLAAWWVLGLVGTAAAQEGPENARPDPLPRPEALPEGETKELQALVMKVTGKARWRTAEKHATWQTMKGDELLGVGAEVMTAGRSSVVLRAGYNSVLELKSRTKIKILVLRQEGATLATHILVPFGDVGVQVDQVKASLGEGDPAVEIRRPAEDAPLLVNNFLATTPSATAAVRGTGYRLRWGALNGQSIEQVESHRLRAIAVQYFHERTPIHLSTASITSDAHPDPVEAALYDTVFPPPSPAFDRDETEGDQATEGFLVFRRIQRWKNLQYGPADFPRNFWPPPVDGPPRETTGERNRGTTEPVEPKEPPQHPRR